MNKNISVWRGIDPPPTNKHVWINEDNNILLHNGFEWVKKLDGVNTSTKITWNVNSDMNDFITPGVYDIYGERTRQNDNLPILNASSGHSIAARLTVVASTLQPANNEICVTQFLMLSNRKGGDGNMYVRTYNQNNSPAADGWIPWQKLQGIREGYIFTDSAQVNSDNQTQIIEGVTGLNNMIDNGVYSGIYTDDGYFDGRPSFIETFTLIVINNYAVVGKLSGLKRTISQLKYAVDAITNQASVKQRTKTDGENWSDWQDISNLAVDDEVTNTSVNPVQSQAIAKTINTEVTRAKEAEQAIIENTDKKIAIEIDKIKDGDTIVGQAREIHSRNGKTVPDSFLVRTTAGSGTIGDGVASLKSVGGNIVKNLIPPINSNSWKLHGSSGNLTFNNGIAFFGGVDSYTGIRTIDEYKTLSGHKYYLMAYIYADSDYLVFVNIGGSAAGNGTVSNKWSLLSFIFNKELVGDVRFLPNVASKSYYITKPILIDLTEMFGAGNEPTKEECDRLFGTMDALPQGLTIANPTEFKSIGFNQFNPENVLEGKAIVNNAIVPGDKKIAVVPCLPCKVGVGENNGYCIHGDFGDDIKVYLTPLNPMEVEGELYMHELTKDATTDTYVPLIKGYMLVEVPTTANLCAHFLWSEDKCERDSYEPYFESKIALPTIPQMSEWGLAGIQSSGTLVCDEIDFERGVYIKRIGSVDLGSFNGSVDKDNVYTITDIFDIAKKSESVANICVEGLNNVNRDSVSTIINSISKNIGGRYIVINMGLTTANEYKSALNGIMLYYELATPEEYPLPKIDNNYISSDYGVEQFDSVVPCNANNLYYMRSLAGETRNFLDRMYDNTAKTDAKEVADYITNGIEGNKELATNAPNLALRALFIAAGMEYNDSGKDITKTTPWGEQVIHMVNRYYLNGLGDITEAQALRIYMNPTNRIYAGAILDTYLVNNMRTSLVAKSEVNISIADKAVNMNNVATNNAYIEIIKFSDRSVIYTNALNHGFYQCGKLKRILDTINVSKVSSFNSTFNACSKLIEVKLSGLRANISFSDSVNLSKNSLLHMITNATPTSAITITLHADAYARLANDVDIVAALAAQPLITLVSA